MILHEFPDLQWLKSQIKHRFANRIGWGNHRLETEGFPNVIIHATTKKAYRPDVKGPLSLFLNIKGNSLCKVDNHTVKVDEPFYFVSNRFQPYTLEIEREQPVETFNIHFGEHFSEGVLHALTTDADRILDGADQRGGGEGVIFFNKLYPRDGEFNRIIGEIYRCSMEGSADRFLLEEQLTQLLTYLLRQHRHILRTVEGLPSAKRSTRVELYKRLSHSLDQLHADFGGGLSLDVLAATACLSKYHFLRLFKSTYGQSPHQYLQQVRLAKARELLQHSSLSVADIADAVGFENSPSFSRLFFQRQGIYPSQYREQVK